MKSGNQDQAEGKLHQAKGAVKEAAGKLIGRPDIEADGQDEMATGKVQEKIGQVKKVFNM